MLRFLGTAWPLLIGMFLLLGGNGLQGTLLGVRGGLEGYAASTMGYVMAFYFAGLIFGSWLTPRLLRRVGHVRVFAALGSTISAVFILYAEVVDPVAWAVMRFVVGACFAGVYIVAESWLNDVATNETRGKALSAYMIAQMLGIIGAQALLTMADASGYTLFVVMSVMVSVSFLPILLSAGPTPVFQTARRMPLKALLKASPLGSIGILLLGGIFACQFGMSSVYATEVGMTASEISIFIGAAYFGGMLLQYPLGWLSDRLDRRLVIIGASAVGAGACLLALLAGSNYWALVVAMLAVGGTSNPLYSLLIAHTNDFLDNEDMASASGGLIFFNGIGAMGTPVLVGYIMGWTGPAGFFGFMGLLLAMIAGYGLWRSTVRRTPDSADTASAIAITQHATTVVAGMAQEIALQDAEDEEAETPETDAATGRTDHGSVNERARPDGTRQAERDTIA